MRICSPEHKLAMRLGQSRCSKQQRFVLILGDVQGAPLGLLWPCLTYNPCLAQVKRYSEAVRVDQMPNKRRARILSERLPLSKSFPMPTSQRNPMATELVPVSAREASSDEEGNGDEKTSRLSIAWNMEASVQHAGDQPLMPITGQQTDGLKENLQRPPDQLIESQAICEQSQAELSRQHGTTQADETAPRASDAHVAITLSCFDPGQEDQIPHVSPVSCT